jgi:hypothetical protein
MLMFMDLSKKRGGKFMSIPMPSACVTCGKPYRKDILKQCPACSSSQLSSSGSEERRASKSNQSFSVSQPLPSSKSVEDLLAEIVKSTTKTKHAVRAFVRFLFIQLSASSLAAALIYWSNPFSFEPNVFLLVAGILVYGVGVVMSSWVGWDELRKSD